MGEAKRRRQTDRNFGKPTRGLILTCPIDPTSETGFTIRSASLDPHELRYALLFWDRLVWPKNKVIHIGSDPSVEFLEQAKVLTRPQYNVSGTISGPAPLIISQAQAFRDLDADPKGIWDICQNSRILIGATAADIVPDGGIGLELIEAIPVPNKDVPLNEVLEFKHRRRDELQALREELDNFARCVNDASDIEGELRAKLDQVDKACSDALRIAGEWQFPVRLSNTKLSLDLKPFEVLAGALAAISGVTFLSGTQATLAGIGGAVWGAKSAMKISGDIGWKGLKPRKTPFAYVAQFHKEVF